MNSTKIRKEVSLDSQVIEKLKSKAQREGRNLKNYMEKILMDEANNFEISETQKNKLDQLLAKYESGKMVFLTEEEFKSKINR